MFADVVNEHYEEGDVVWCHDYHLMFLPKCLKEYNSKMKVGWFLHTPFPSSEIHRTLPSRSELLRSVLAADLVGWATLLLWYFLNIVCLAHGFDMVWFSTTLYSTTVKLFATCDNTHEWMHMLKKFNEHYKIFLPSSRSLTFPLIHE